MVRNDELVQVAKKAADAWRNTDAYHQAAQIIDMLVEELEGDTLTQPNEPLTLEELREMSGQPFWDDAGSGWWIVAHVDGSKIYTEEGAILDFYEEGEEDVYFRRPPEGGNDVR